jgi:hypothetical protein
MNIIKSVIYFIMALILSKSILASTSTPIKEFAKNVLLYQEVEDEVISKIRSPTTQTCIKYVSEALFLKTSMTIAGHMFSVINQILAIHSMQKLELKSEVEINLSMTIIYDKKKALCKLILDLNNQKNEKQMQVFSIISLSEKVPKTTNRNWKKQCTTNQQINNGANKCNTISICCNSVELQETYEKQARYEGESDNVNATCGQESESIISVLACRNQKQISSDTTSKDLPQQTIIERIERSRRRQHSNQDKADESKTSRGEAKKKSKQRDAVVTTQHSKVNNKHISNNCEATIRGKCSRSTEMSKVQQQVTGIPGGNDINQQQQQAKEQAQALAMLGDGNFTNKVISCTSMNDSIINFLPTRKCGGATTVQRDERGRNNSDQANASGKPKSETVLYAESQGMKIRCINTSMHQIRTPDDDGNENIWKQQRVLDQQKRQASPVSKGRRRSGECVRSVQDSIIRIKRLPMRK